MKKLLGIVVGISIVTLATGAYAQSSGEGMGGSMGKDNAMGKGMSKDAMDHAKGGMDHAKDGMTKGHGDGMEKSDKMSK